jgi:hypothetical protein
MRAARSMLRFTGILACAGLPASAGAQPVGSEFQVNTYTTSFQGTASAAADANGNFVVVWLSVGQDGSGNGIFAQRYNSEGGVLGVEFRVNSFTGNDQRYPSVASNAPGDFVVVWASEQTPGSHDVFGRRYDSAGNALGTEFRVNSYTTGDQAEPSVASDARGNFVVVWRSSSQDGSGSGVFGQRYDNGGMAQGDEFRVNSSTTGTQWRPAVASDVSGNFVVAWDGRYDLYGQRYDSEGVALGAEFRVNAYTTFNQQRPDVASDASGNFVVVWHGFGEDDNLGIFGQRYDNAGAAQGTQFQVNSYTTYHQRYPSLAFDASGNFVVVWESGALDTPGQDGSGYGVFGQRYDTAGAVQGDEFQVNAFTTNFQRTPSAAATGTDKYVVAWTSAGQDGSSSGVFGQRFDFGGTGTISVVSPNTNLTWRIGSVRQIQWTHTLGANATFRIELDRDNDGDYEELIAADAVAISPTRGSYAWTVNGPPSRAARVLVSWTDDLAVSDSSDNTFQIRSAP